MKTALGVAVLADAGVCGCAYGTRSNIRLIIGDDLPPIHDPDEFTSVVSSQFPLQPFGDA